MGGLILPDVAGQLVAPAAAIEHKQRRERTLVPALYQLDADEWAARLSAARKAAADRLAAHGGLLEKVREIYKASAVDAFYSPGGFLDAVRSHHRVMHVMAKGAPLTLCQCKPPEGYPVLKSLTQDENAIVMTWNRTVAPQWHQLQWCGACTTFAGWLVRKAA